MFSLSFLFYCWAWLLLLPQPPPQVKAITSADAKRHVGEVVKVCGVLASLYEPKRSRRNPTFLNFDQPYPKNEFTAIIWRWQRPAFGDLQARLGKQVCVIGLVREYGGRAQIVLTKAEQLAK